MNVKPSRLPELRDLTVDEEVTSNVECALRNIEKELDDWSQGICSESYLKNVGVALIFTCQLNGRLSLAEQWVLRQKLLEYQWDEVEFELNGDGTTRVALIEHKNPASPRTLVFK